MDNENTKDPLSEMTEKIGRNILGVKVAADTGEGHDWATIFPGDGLIDKTTHWPIKNLCIYNPKIGEVFAHVADAKIYRVVRIAEQHDGLFHKFEEIDFANGNKGELHLTFEKTMMAGAFKVKGFLDNKADGTYIRVNPVLWDKAETQRGIFLSSLNALTYSINPDEPFNS